MTKRKIRWSARGLTLLELMIALGITALITVALAGFTRSMLEAKMGGDESLAPYDDGLAAMERMTNAVKQATFVLIPNGAKTSRTILAVSGFLNDDGDFYFGDSLFPRIDEDLGADMTGDGKPGIIGYDDDGDGYTDTSGDNHDDDEDNWPWGNTDEERLDGDDDDYDGSIDEDLGRDMNGDAAAGVRYMDDDGDGAVDEGGKEDDDEDGSKDEDPLNPRIFDWNNKTNTLYEVTQSGKVFASAPLCENVTSFEVIYRPEDWSYRTTLVIRMTVTGSDGRAYTFDETVYPRNTDQHYGKRVR